MGREIRLVPKDWEHPRNERGHFQPLHDATFQDAAREWKERLAAWETSPERKGDMEYWEWGGDPPDRKYYRQAWPDGAATHFQIYETVSEGTPVSPVFATRDALANWLVTQGHSRNAADAFAKDGWAPSMVVTNVGGKVDIKMGIDSMGDL